jgi:cell division protein ZapA
VTDQNRESVTVRIAGEEHTIRSSAEPEYTVRCAEYVDRRIHEIKKQIGLVEGHKLAILAALSITDEMFQAQDLQDQSGSQIAERVNALAARLEDTLSDG